MNRDLKAEVCRLVDAGVSRAFKRLMQERDHPSVGIHLLPGGRMPVRKSKGAIGYDVRVRAIVCPWEMDRESPYLRKTLFDFRGVILPSARPFVERRRCDPGWKYRRLVYRLEPREMALCGIGFVTEMAFPLCYLTLCRSGIAAKHNVIVANGPGTVDPDYRGEAGIILFNCGKTPFYIYEGMRIAQVKFTYAVIPDFFRIDSYGDFGKTDRSCNGFGSTGLH